MYTAFFKRLSRLNPLRRLYSFLAVDVLDPKDIHAVKCVLEGSDIKSIKVSDNPSHRITGEILVKSHKEFTDKLDTLGIDLRNFNVKVRASRPYPRNFAPGTVETPLKYFIENFVDAIIVFIVLAVANFVMFFFFHSEFNNIILIIADAIIATIFGLWRKRRGKKH